MQKYWVLAIFLFAGVAQAVNLGGVRVLSRAGEPLRAEVVLTGMSAAESGTVSAGLASPDIFAASGLMYPAVLDSVRVAVVKSGDGFALRLTSDQPVTDATLTPIIELSVNGDVQLKAISIGIPGGRASAPVAAPPAPAPVAPSATPPWPVPASAPNPPTGAQPSGAKAPSAPVVPAASTKPAATATMAASITEAVRQELKQQAAGIVSENEAVRRDLKEAKEKVEALNSVVEKMNGLISTQQQIIEAQSGTKPVRSLVAEPPTTTALAPLVGEASATQLAPSGPVVIERERDNVNFTSMLMGAASGVIVTGLGLLLFFSWQQRREKQAADAAAAPRPA